MVATARRIGWGWAGFKYDHRAVCLCGHAKWHHAGFEGSACTHLGSCPCLRYRKDPLPHEEVTHG